MIDERTDRDGMGGATVAIAGDRRKDERYSAADDRAWVGWWEGRIYRKSPAALVDISEGGARLVAEFGPPSRATAWVCVDGPHRTEWVEGVAVEVARLVDGTAAVHLAFRDACPAAFFMIALRVRARFPLELDCA